jgi:hypothetical protein
VQEKINHSTENKLHRRYTSKGERLAHIRKWQESGLPVTEYCREQKIALTSFLGWRRASASVKSEQKFKPVITKSPPSDAKISPDNVIEIMAEHGIKIRLLNVTDASLALNIARGLIKCS